MGFLIIVAGPGSGKSVLAKFILQKLERRSADTGDPVFGFFCKNAEGRNSSSSIIRYFLFALLNHRRELFRRITPFLARQPLSDNSLSFQNLWKMFLAVLSDPELETVRFIIDGLDECKGSSQQELLRAIELSFKDKMFKGRFLITSRPTAVASDYGTRLGILQINAEDVAGDLSLIVQAEVDKLALSRGYPEEISATVKKKLEGEADGMFLWVDLVLEELSRDELADTRQTIDKVLASLPRSLSDFYARNLENLGTAAENVLQILLAAPQPLRASDLAVFHAQWPNECSSLKELEPCLPLNIGRYSKAICGSFIKVIDNRIGFVHQSALDYLTSQVSVTIHQETRSGLALDMRVAHQKMLKTCLKYLSLKEIMTEAAITKLDSLFLKYPFVEYALSCLAMHTVQSGALDQETRALFNQFFSHGNPILVAWIQYSYWRVFDLVEIPNQLNPSNSLLGTLTLDDAIHVFRNDFADEDNKRNSFLDILIRQYNIDLNAEDHMGFTPLDVAVMTSSIKAVKFLLQSGSRHDIRDTEGRTALHFASKTSVAALIQDAGADLNAKDDRGNTPLHASAQFGRQEVVEFLLSRKADVDSPNELGQSPLYMSMASGHPVICDQLIAEGADPYRLSKEKDTMMFPAASSGHTSLIDLARQYGLSISDRNMRGETPLHRSALSSTSTLSHLIELGADLNARDDKGRTPLHFATGYGNESLGRILLDAGADLNDRDVEGRTPLLFATACGNESLVRVLLDAGADPLIANDYKYTVLHQAAQLGKDSLIQQFLGLMEDPQIEDIDGITALSVAAFHGHTNVVKLLIEQGFNAEKQDNAGLAPLHLASSSGNLEIASLLIASGSSVELRDRYGETPLMFAVDHGHISVARLLLESGADVNQSSRGVNCLHLAVTRPSPELIDILIQHSPDVSARGPTGATCLHYAAEGGNVAALEAILAAGVDINAVDNRGYSAIHFAALGGHLEATKRLFEVGANMQALSSSKRSPLHCAVLSGKLDVVTMLLNLNLDRNAEDENSDTPLMLLEQEGYPGIAKLLEDKGTDIAQLLMKPLPLPDANNVISKAPGKTIFDTIPSESHDISDVKMAANIQKALNETLAETKFPTDMKQREDFFMKEVQLGEESLIGSCRRLSYFPMLTAKQDLLHQRI